MEVVCRNNFDIAQDTLLEKIESVRKYTNQWLNGRPLIVGAEYREGQTLIAKGEALIETCADTREWIGQVSTYQIMVWSYFTKRR